MDRAMFLLVAVISLNIENHVFVSGTPARERLHSFNKESHATSEKRHTALQCLHYMRKILKKYPHFKVSEVRKAPEWQTAWDSIASEICTEQPDIQCNPADKFRTSDGSCNNLKFPSWGQSFRPQQRFLFPAYADGVGSPRTPAKSGAPLASPRVISNAIFQTTGPERFQKKKTMVVMSFGQFLDHDLIFTPVMSGADGEAPDCCSGVDDPPGACFPITIPTIDPAFTRTCHNFVRSSPIFDNPCRPGVREQNNELTSYIDGSNVYGSTEEEANSLRAFKDGLLAVYEKKELPPPLEGAEESAECVVNNPNDFCMHAGDRRVNEVSHLTVNHIAFLREHNRIAKKLAKINPHWDDERLYQETRKIIGAILQKIVYDDWLPCVLHKGYLRRFCLKPSSRSYRCRRMKYNPHIDATIRNAFGMALRMGHSLVPGIQGLASAKHKTTTVIPIEETFNDPHLAIIKEDELARFVIKQPAMIMDRFIEDGLRDKLFLANGIGFDLGSLNINRGRDHGIPPYVEYRKFCGLSPVSHFKRSRGGLIDHTEETAAKLEEVYEHVADIDLFVGGLSETPLPGSIIGPTFSCLFAKTFRALKFGDRFFYEHKGLVNSLTKAQIGAIKKVKLSKIYCENFKIEKIQCDIFKLPEGKKTPCSRLDDLDLGPWRERNRY